MTTLEGENLMSDRTDWMKPFPYTVTGAVGGFMMEICQTPFPQELRILS